MSGFVFQWPAALALLLLVLPLAWLLARARRKRARLSAALGGEARCGRRSRDVLRLVAFGLLGLALARPGYAPHLESVSRSGRDVVFALDVSQSMLAEDTSPSRLEVAKQAIRDALGVFGNERAGLVVYAGSASILCPLTHDYEFVRYMLEQAQPRTVDFGGTTLQSAVEKAVDQVFIEGREGVQDLLVLTDGGDHGSQMANVADLLAENQVSTLIVGIGDPDRGHPIPVRDEAGATSLLQGDGKTVLTRLEDAALRTFAARSPRTTYFAAGTTPFNLGARYLEYAAGKPVAATDSDSGIVFYKEAAPFLVFPAAVLLVLAERPRLGRRVPPPALALLLAGAAIPGLDAAGDTFRAEFDAGVELMRDGRYEEAAAAFSSLQAAALELADNPGDLAAVEMNHGLCLVKLSQGEAEQDPEAALSHARQAQAAFLAAKRYAPSLTRAGVRLELTASWIGDLAATIALQRQAEDEMRQQIEALVERLQKLLEAQGMLRAATTGDADLSRLKGNDTGQALLEVNLEEQRLADPGLLSAVQGRLLSEANSIRGELAGLGAALAPPGQPKVDTLVADALKAFERAIGAQTGAQVRLATRGDWRNARAALLIAERGIAETIELLTGGSDQQSGDGEQGDEYDEDYEYQESDDTGESMPSSEPLQGDLAAGAEMQPLPLPNYTAEDILMEEMGNQQFRQQSRASANAGRVEKDY